MKKLVLLDMDGTIYLGNTLFPCVPNVFKFLDENNIRYMFLTNNSSKTKNVYVKKLSSMGLNCDESNFYTSVETTIKYLKDNNYKKIYVLGVKAFKNILSEQFDLVDKWEKGMKIDAVVASFDTELVYDELKDACLFIQDGADFLATNIDYRCPIEDGYYIPDCGGLCEWIKLCTNKSATFFAPCALFKTKSRRPDTSAGIGCKKAPDGYSTVRLPNLTIGVLFLTRTLSFQTKRKTGICFAIVIKFEST